MKVTEITNVHDQKDNEPGFLTDLFIDFINNFRNKEGVAIYKEELERAVRERKHMLIIDYRDLKKFNEALARKFERDPESAIESIVNYLYLDVINDDNFKKDVPDLTIGIVGYDNIVSLDAVKSLMYLDKLVTVEGVVIAISEEKQHTIYAAVYHYIRDNGDVKVDEHPHHFKQDYLYDDIVIDKYCDNYKKNAIKVDFSDDESIKTNWQLAVLQEKPDKMKHGKTEPAKVKVVLTRDLVGTLHPGDVVKVIGFVKTRSLNNKAKATEDYYIVALGIEHEQTPYSDAALTIDDLRKIEELKKNPKKLMTDIILSIAPTVYDPDKNKIKEAIALALVGGTPAEDGEERGDIHVLIIGEPGVGKTKTLRSVRRIVPKSIYVSGEMATSVGLGVGLTKDPDTGEWLAEAGALVLADGGVALIDEIDKLNPKDRVALREAMENQTVTLTKIIKGQFNARTTIIAAGNPKGDIFGPGNAYQYIDMDISLLSRYDIIFAVKKKLNEKQLEFMAGSTIKTTKTTLTNFMYNPPINDDLLKKIIVYARTYVFPSFTEEAYKELLSAAKYLITLSNANKELNKLMSGRELHKLRRLATAYARLQLKDVVEKEEVKMAFDMIMESLSSLGFFGKEEGSGQES